MQNTTDEDSMVVQYILAARKGRREVKSDATTDKPCEEKKPETLDEIKEEKIEIPAEENESHLNEELVVSDKETKEPVVETDVEIDNSLRTEEIEEVKHEVPLPITPSIEPVIESKSDDQKEEPTHSDDVNKTNTDTVKSENSSSPSNKQAISSIKPDAKYIEVEEYYVKYRNFSYLHCEWKTEEELYKGDKRISAKLKRFKQKMAHQTNIFENVSTIILFYFVV